MRGRLLRWYRRRRRALPWRSTTDPYAIWVSEVMLQQTQVTTVIPYYLRFLERFPDPATLAAAREEEVLAAWSGLGYYRRARALHAGARAVVANHDALLPRDPAALRELPGIGRYTAGAIASIAFGFAEPILDGNVRRVLSRLFAVDGRELSRSAEDRRLWELAGRLVRGNAPGDLNQALMELGALICSPREPDCEACPVAGECRGRRSGLLHVLPALRPARPTERVPVAVAWIRGRHGLLLERPAEGSPFRGSWDLPAAETGSVAAAAPMLVRALERRHGLELRVTQTLGHARHGILHRRLELAVIGCRLVTGKVARSPRLMWADSEGLAHLPISGATRKIARKLGVDV
jgi:A/G-specific adenine glycosylase